jgi:hypothetical protein
MVILNWLKDADLIKLAQDRIQGWAVFVQEEKILDQMNVSYLSGTPLHVVSGVDK